MTFRPVLPSLPPQPQQRIDETWVWSYNLNLIGQDQLPRNQKDWPNPYPVQWYRSLEVRLTPGALQAPFSQLYWPNPVPVTWYQSQTSSYNLNLIGQDQLPTRQQYWPNPYPVQWYRSIENRLTPGQLASKPPFRQQDWPNPYPVSWYQSQTTGYVLSLIGKDKLPINQKDWPYPLRVFWQLGQEGIPFQFRGGPPPPQPIILGIVPGKPLKGETFTLWSKDYFGRRYRRRSWVGNKR